MTATEFQARALALLDEVAGGDQIEITKRGRTVTRLVGPGLRGRPEDGLAQISRSVGDDESRFCTGAPWDLP